jgi:FAD/FMN-containing dehydrogenase
MTTATIVAVGHGSKQPTVVEIDRFRGRLISASDADYDSARAIWNGAIDRRPQLIARCIGTADVVSAMRFARDHDPEIAILGGGHNVAGTAVYDDGIVIASRRCGACESILPTAGPGCRVVLSGATSTMRRRRTAWPPPAES